MKRICLTAIMCGIIATSSVATYSLEQNEFIAKRVDFDVLVNGDKFVSKNPIVEINGTTYLSLKDTGKALGVKINWDSKERRVEVEQKNKVEVAPVLKDTNGIEIKTMYPKDNDTGIYLKWKYISLVFNQPMKGIKDREKIYLIDEFGNRIKIKDTEPGVTAKDNFLLILDNDLELNTSYKLFIPKDSILTEQNKPFGLEIVTEFKTASNVVKGRIDSSTDYFGRTLILEGQNNRYETSIVGKNEFFIYEIPGGKYDLKIEGENPIETEISVESDKINSFIVK